MRFYSMKNLILVIVISFLAFNTIGCSDTRENVVKKQEETNRGITMNKIPFEILKDLPEGSHQNPKNKGYEYFETEDGYYVLVVYAGEKSTGGYSIHVTNIEDNEGEANIFVKEISPEPGSFVTQAIIYPYTVVKFKGTTDDFHVINEETNEEYPPLD